MKTKHFVKEGVQGFLDSLQVFWNKEKEIIMVMKPSNKNSVKCTNTPFIHIGPFLYIFYTFNNILCNNSSNYQVIQAHKFSEGN